MKRTFQDQTGKVDGKFFSWYDSRLLRAAGYFERLQQRIPSAL